MHSFRMVLLPILSHWSCTVASNMFRILYKYHYYFLFLSFIHHQNIRKTLICHLSQLESMYVTTRKEEHFPYHILSVEISVSHH